MKDRRILDGVLEQWPKEQILDSLSGHVSAELELLDEALDAGLSETKRMLLETLLQQHDRLSAQLHRLDSQLQQALQPYQDQLNLLKTIPGINQKAATALLAEIGPHLHAFDNMHSFAAWTGLVPGNNESAGKRRRGRIRHGNNNLALTLIECAHAAARTKGCQFQPYHKALLVRRGYRRAIVATAHKLARVIYAVLRDQKPYRDPEADYEELLVRRNAPHWLSELKKFGILRMDSTGTCTIHW